MKLYYTIETICQSDGEKDIIGVADSLEYVDTMIQEYFGRGKYEVIKKRPIEDSGLEYELTIRVFAWESFEEEIETIIVRYFILNQA